MLSLKETPLPCSPQCGLYSCHAPVFLRLTLIMVRAVSADINREGRLTSLVSAVVYTAFRFMTGYTFEKPGAVLVEFIICPMVTDITSFNICDD